MAKDTCTPSNVSSGSKSEANSPKSESGNQPQMPSTRREVDPAYQVAAARRECGDHSDEELVVLQKWLDAEDYAELINLNRQFLRGDLPFSTYHNAAIWSETEALAPGLLSLHDFGMLTIGSQPSAFIGADDDKFSCCAEFKWSETRQRAYIIFLLPAKSKSATCASLKKFLVEMMVDDDFYVSIMKTAEPCRFGKCFRRTRTIGSFPAEWCTHIVRSADEKEDLKHATPVEEKNIDLHCSCWLSIFSTDADVIETLNPLIVYVLAKGWEEQDLAGLVEKAAIKAGLKRAYAESSNSDDDEMSEGSHALPDLEGQSESFDDENLPDLVEEVALAAGKQIRPAESCGGVELEKTGHDKGPEDLVDDVLD